MTYCYKTPSSDCLEQGDILQRTPELDRVLQQVHPHYFHNKQYRAFVVLTQSCDLVKRAGGACKSHYITIAGAKPLDVAISRELESHQSTLERAAGVASFRTKEHLRDFLRKLFNNNEPRYFYLNQDAGAGLAESLCVFLALSIAIRAREHYAACMNARIASVDDVFQAKLGWLVGNMYSRVGTPDWVPSVEDAPAFDRRIDGILNLTATYLDDKKLGLAKKQIPAELYGEGEDALRRRINGIQAPTRRQRVLDAVVKALANDQVLGERTLTAPEIETVKRALASDVGFKAATDG